MNTVGVLLGLSLASFLVPALVSATPRHDHSIRTPAHLLAKRNSHFPRSLLEGQLTVGSLLNTTVEVGGTLDSPATNTSASSPPTSPTPASPSRGSCFPFKSDGFVNGTVPNISRSDWWCPDKDMYGFLGFSYPLEVSDCSDLSNQYSKIRTDLGRMKDEFGATFVRPYGVECRDTSVWLNLIRACIDLGMALIVQVWWGFQTDQTLWQRGQANLYEVFETSDYAQIAPYVVYSASFGSEPIGDWVDGDNFIRDLASFRSKMNSFGVPVGISEDWDRPNRMKVGAAAAVADVGAAVLNNTDVAQLHVMPYYHPDEVPTIDDTWTYISAQVQWARQTLRQPTMITETMWSSQPGGSHGRGSHDEERTLDNYRKYWDDFSSNCDFFKAQETGYFVHTYDDSMEPYFGMVDSNGVTKVGGWKPRRC